MKFLCRRRQGGLTEVQKLFEDSRDYGDRCNNALNSPTAYNRTNAAAQAYSYNGMDDRVKLVRPSGTRHFVYDSGGRVMGGSTAERA